MRGWELRPVAFDLAVPGVAAGTDVDAVHAYVVGPGRQLHLHDEPMRVAETGKRRPDIRTRDPGHGGTDRSAVDVRVDRERVMRVRVHRPSGDH